MQVLCDNRRICTDIHHEPFLEQWLLRCTRRDQPTTLMEHRFVILGVKNDERNRV